MQCHIRHCLRLDLLTSKMPLVNTFQLTLASETQLHMARRCCQAAKGIVVVAGVYVGCMYHEYIDYMFESGAKIPAQTFIGNGPPYMVGRLSYTFGLTGPCVSTDTACSSSLVAVHLGSRAISGMEAQAAVAAGTNIMLLSQTSAGICQLQVAHLLCMPDKSAEYVCVKLVL